MNRDDLGVLCQIQRRDGSLECGDGVCWTGHWIYLTKNPFPLSIFEVSPGAYVRHPDPKMTNHGFGAHYEHPWSGCISRDQLTGILAAIIALKDYKAAMRLILHHMCRLMLFAYNTIENGTKEDERKWQIPDITFMDIWAMELRCLGPVAWILHPVLWVLDLHMLLSALYFNLFDKDTDAINFAMKAITSRQVAPTPISWITWKIIDKPKLILFLKTYWAGWRQQPEMVSLYVRQLEKK